MDTTADGRVEAQLKSLRVSNHMFVCCVICNCITVSMDATADGRGLTATSTG